MKPNKSKILSKVIYHHIRMVIICVILILIGINESFKFLLDIEPAVGENHLWLGLSLMFLSLLFIWRVVWRSYKREYFAQLWSDKK